MEKFKEQEMSNKAELERITKMEEELAEMKVRLSAVDKWEPNDGEFIIGIDGGVMAKDIGFAINALAFGLVYKTPSEAAKAAKAMRTHNRLLAYVAEHAPGYEADFSTGGEDNYYVYFRHLHKRYEVGCNSSHEVAGVVYMPEDVAKELARKLNSGEVVL
jgi:hypothetical protein